MKRLILGILVAFGLVSVSFGAWIPPYHESRYQKLKAEVEEYGDVGKCKWDEDGKGNHSEGVDWRVCKFQNIIAFFDEIRATDVKGAKTEYDEFAIAMRKVMEMSRFNYDKCSSCGIPSKTHFRIFDGNRQADFKDGKGFWESVWNNWESAKNKMEMDGARRGYWKKLAE